MLPITHEIHSFVCAVYRAIFLSYLHIFQMVVFVSKTLLVRNIAIFIILISLNIFPQCVHIQYMNSKRILLFFNYFLIA